MLKQINPTPRKKRLNEGNIFVTMQNPHVLFQMTQPLIFPVNDPIGLYGRQSSLFQFQNRTESRDYQIEEQRSILILQYRWKPEMIYEYFQDFAESGTLGIGERVGITRLMEDIQSGFIKAVYVFLVDRLFRDKLLENVVRFAKVCYEKHIIIITSCYIYRMWISDDYEKFIEDCKLAWKALDLQLNKRMLPMRAFASHAGKYDSRTMNIGYVVDRDKHSPTYKRYIPLQKHAEIVEEKLFKRVIDYGGDAYALMHELEQQEGVHFPWHDDPLFNSRVRLIKIPGVGYRIGAYSTLMHILRNPVYIGTWKAGDKAYPDKHKAIITREVWDTVQYLLDKRQAQTRPTHRNHAPDSILKGLILRPFPGWQVTVSPVKGEINFAWKDGENLMRPNRQDILPLPTVETMFKDAFTRRLLQDTKCYEYAKAATDLHKAAAKDREHIQETINGLEARRQAILDDLENPKTRKKMSERTIEEKYEKVADMEGEISRLQAVLNKPTKYIPLPELLTLIEQLRENWDSLEPATIRNAALVFCKGIHLQPRSSHIWSFEIQWELWPSDNGIIWLNFGTKYHWNDADLATLQELTARAAPTTEILEALPTYSQVAISDMSLRRFGKRAVPKCLYRLDTYMTRQDVSVLAQYGIGVERIAALKGAVKARDLSGGEYWSLARISRENQDAIFFAGRNSDVNSEVICSIAPV